MAEIKIPKKAAGVHEEQKDDLPKVKVPKVLTPLQGFVDFVREQGVVGLAVGIVLGAQIKTLVDSFVVSFVNPLLGLLLPGNGNLALKTLTINVGSKKAVFLYGAFLTQVISFMIVAAIVYYVVHGLKLDKLDKKKQ
ncbi:MAG: MscL family protein [Candidatus Saccharimonadales bacterium]